MATFDAVPVLDVHNDNFKQTWPTLVLALKSATFVALDLEMSGLGNRRLLLTKSIEDRYNALSEVARTRSVVSLGISCFKFQENPALKDEDADCEAKTNVHFFVQTFNLTLLCKESYSVEPESLRFLVHHGFDFNKQYAKGISYYRGPDKEDDKDDFSIRQLLSEVIVNKIPVVLHNGLVDLAFLYHSFYATLPQKLSVFVADLSEMFTGGIYDTKYIIEYEVRMTSSYLEYVFRKSQKDNAQKEENGEHHVRVSFPKYPESCDYVEYRECSLPEKSRDYTGVQTCEPFAAFGWCKLADKCPNSHDIDTILNFENLAKIKKRQKKNQRKKKKRQRRNSSATAMDEEEESEGDEEEGMETQEIKTDGTETSVESNLVGAGKHDSEQETMNKDFEGVVRLNSRTETKNVVTNGETSKEKSEEKLKNSRCSGHRAGFDAFMTGYTLAAAVSKCGKLSVQQTESFDKLRLTDFGLGNLRNNIYLSGKDFPLKVTKSSFSKSSKEHRAKYAKLMRVEAGAMDT